MTEQRSPGSTTNGYTEDRNPKKKIQDVLEKYRFTGQAEERRNKFNLQLYKIQMSKAHTVDTPHPVSLVSEGVATKIHAGKKVVKEGMNINIKKKKSKNNLIIISTLNVRSLKNYENLC